MLGFGLEYVIPILSSLGIGIGSIGLRFVQEGELGIRLRFGKAVRDKQGVPRVINPGFTFLIPFVDRLQKRHVRQETLQFDSQDITLKDNLIFHVSGTVIFKVTDVYRAMFEIENVGRAIDVLGTGILREGISALNQNELQDTGSISQRFLEELQKRTAEWGVDVIEFRLNNCSPSLDTAHIITAKSAVQQRTAALLAAAETLGYDSVHDMPSALSAALIGVPVVTAISTSASARSMIADTYNDTDNSKHVHLSVLGRHIHQSGDDD